MVCISAFHFRPDHSGAAGRISTADRRRDVQRESRARRPQAARRSEYRVKQPGDVQYLASAQRTAGDTGLSLCRLGIDPESDEQAITSVEITVPIADLCLFEPTRHEVTGFERSSAIDVLPPRNGRGADWQRAEDVIYIPFSSCQMPPAPQ